MSLKYKEENESVTTNVKECVACYKTKTCFNNSLKVMGSKLNLLII